MHVARPPVTLTRMLTYKEAHLRLREQHSPFSPLREGELHGLGVGPRARRQPAHVVDVPHAARRRRH